VEWRGWLWVVGEGGDDATCVVKGCTAAQYGVGFFTCNQVGSGRTPLSTFDKSECVRYIDGKAAFATKLANRC
jgi:hypothetical protein